MHLWQQLVQHPEAFMYSATALPAWFSELHADSMFKLEAQGPETIAKPTILMKTESQHQHQSNKGQQQQQHSTAQHSAVCCGLCAVGCGLVMHLHSFCAADTRASGSKAIVLGFRVGKDF